MDLTTEQLIQRNKEIREKYLTGEYTQVAVGKVYGLKQNQVRYILWNRLSYEPEDTKVIPEEYLRVVARNALREDSIPPEELRAMVQDWLSGEFTQRSLGKKYGITQGCVSWRLRHFRLTQEEAGAAEELCKKRSLFKREARKT